MFWYKEPLNKHCFQQQIYVVHNSACTSQAEISSLSLIWINCVIFLLTVSVPFTSLQLQLIIKDLGSINIHESEYLFTTSVL